MTTPRAIAGAAAVRMSALRIFAPLKGWQPGISLSAQTAATNDAPRRHSMTSNAQAATSQANRGATIMSDHTPEQIAARLSPAQKKAMLWLPSSMLPEYRRDSTDAKYSTLKALQERGLCARGFQFLRWKATPLGLAVRAIIEKEGRKDE